MINSNKKKVTVDFHWATESEDGTTGYGFYIKHHHTEEYGPTISISETENDYTSLPAKMFVEVVDFLRSEGVLEPSEVFKAAVEASSRVTLDRAKSGYAVPPERDTTLSIPVIENSSVPQVEQEEQEDTDEIYIDNSNPITSFDSDSTPQNAQEQPQIATGESQVVKNASGPSDVEKAAEMAAERVVAAAKAKSNASIKKSHKIEDET